MVAAVELVDLSDADLSRHDSIVRIYDSTSATDRDVISRAVRKVLAAQKACRGQRRRLKGMTTIAHRETAQMLATIVGPQALVFLPKMRVSDMKRRGKDGMSHVRGAFDSYRAAKLHDVVVGELEQQGATWAGEELSNEHGSTSQCMIDGCNQWGRAQGRVFICKHCQTRVLRDGQGG